MDTVFINFKNSKTTESYRFLVNFADKISLKNV